MTKWGDRPHSEFTGVYLGADDHGDWVGARAGTRCWRRERFFDQRSDWVTLLPGTGTCRWARAALSAEEPPFDGSHLRWLSALRERVPA